MHPSDYVMSDSERKTRKRWLLSLFCCTALCPLILLALFAVLSFWFPFARHALIERSVGACTSLITMWVMWHCAYKKHGTKLLTFWLMILPLFGIKGMGTIFPEVVNKNYPISMLCIMPLDIGLCIWCFLLSLNVWKINKAVRERKTLAAQNTI